MDRRHGKVKRPENSVYKAKKKIPIQRKRVKEFFFYGMDSAFQIVFFYCEEAKFVTQN